MKELVEYIIQNLATNQDEAEVICEEEEDRVHITVLLASEDMGRVIGRQGRIAKSIRAILKAVAMKEDKLVTLDIEEKQNE